jgi:hypothetical protein
LSEEAATPTGGAEVAARPETSAPSVHDRLKAAIFTETESTVAPNTGKPEAPKQEAKAPQEAKEASEAADEPKEDAQSEEQQEQTFESIEELAEALGWEQDKLFSLAAKTKIDGKEGKATLRDLIKSHQLEGHLNQKLMTFAEEKKAFETERQTYTQQTQHKLQQLDAGVKIAQKLLEGEFAQVDWQGIQNEDPVAFAQKFASFQQRQAQINHVANLLGQEHTQAQQQAAAQQQAYLQEQMRLLESKVPEWSSDDSRKKALNEMGSVFKESYGIPPEELGSVSDHRFLLVARDAWQWQKLQKAKPAVVNKVKTAPKLLKPGTPMSQATKSALQLNHDAQRLKESGKVRHAKPLLKQILFGNR